MVEQADMAGYDIARNVIVKAEEAAIGIGLAG
jgi:hypothetical protein